MFHVALCLLAPAFAQAPADAPSFDPARFAALDWREVGPYRGGRCAAVTGVRGNRDVYYFGACGGGVWKTIDGGDSWRNVSDGSFGGSIGAVAVAESDPNVIYVGGGEKTVRGNVSHGDGVWRSVDAGKTWVHAGLADSRHVPRIRVHPKDADLVYVAALGHLFGPSSERGVYRSRDGGETWQRILFANDRAGAVDLALDPTNPRILYASTWRVLRTPWSLESGGPGSALWKSTDGGDTWTEISANAGFPRGTLGIIGVAVSPSNAHNVYAIVENEEGGVFRSRDGGATWTRTNSDRELRQRAWYYTRIYADPADEDSVYVLNVQFHHAKDGGRTFRAISVPHSDNHDLWIDPDDPLRMIQSNDGGANVSYDRGETWSRQSNQPTAQMYRVSTDGAFPYRLLGGQQDNSTVRIRSRSFTGGSIGERDWEPTAGGESGHVVARPDDPEVVFGGSYGGYLARVDHRTGERRAVDVWPDDPMGWGAAELRYRFQWNFPIFFSPHDPGLLYAAANVLFRTRDEGASWEAISPDLTANDRSKMGPSGGPITKDNTSVEYWGTIFAALESPHEPGVLWAGTDDGKVQLSRDAGATWSDVTPADAPDWLMVNSVEAHPFEPGGLYVAGTRYKLDDFQPYLYRTTDYGASWTRIDAGIDEKHFTRALRADPERRGLLYTGTERGVYVSFDDGASWASLQLDLPIVPVTDLAVKEGDLVAATQGRGYWILDDLSVLRQLSPEAANAAAWLFTPRPTDRLGGGRSRAPRDAGTNPPSGAVIWYSLHAEPAADVELALEILEEDGDLVQRFTRKPPREEARERRPDDGPDLRQLDANAGLNQFVWDLRYPGADSFPGMVLWSGGTSGPRAVPGTYRARLTLGEWQAEVPFELLPDPRSSSSVADMQEQFRFLSEVRDQLTAMHREIEAIRDVRGQVDALLGRLADDESKADLREAGKALVERIEAVEKGLYQTQNRSRQDPLNFPIRLNDKLAGLASTAGVGDHAPTAQAWAVKAEAEAAIDAELAKLGEAWEGDLAEFNRKVAEAGVPAVMRKGE